jgi:hypothetical protein
MPRPRASGSLPQLGDLARGLVDVGEPGREQWLIAPLSGVPAGQQRTRHVEVVIRERTGHG